MFDSLSDRFDAIFTRLRGRGRLSDEDVDEVLREIRLALLQADVNIRVVRTFVSRVRDQTVGAELSKSLQPAQQVIKIVHDELVAVLGGEVLKITYASKPPTVVLLAGLQGSGKTTAAGKLARWFKQQGRNPLLAAADLQRPAAVEQLRVLGRQAGVPVFSEPSDPVTVTKKALEEAQRLGRDVLIIDTAGRLAIDEALMQEVADVRDATSPHESLLVADAMTGQDAVNVAKAFNERVGLSGIVLTRIDGDARGGAALSMRAVTGKPIKLIGTGEKLDALEDFHPDRIAGRILGMGDVVSLVERAAETVDREEAEKLAEKFHKGQGFDFDDLLKQLRQVRKMGGMTGVLGMLPGIGKVKKQLADAKIDDGMIKRQEAIILSMTKAERRNWKLLNARRKIRIASGSGTTVPEVNRLLKQFQDMSRMMKQVQSLNKRGVLQRALPGLLGRR
jgi:signal recognition particle subunit SRP54